MKSKTLFYSFVGFAFFSLLLFSCGPSGVTSGTYTGTFTSDSLPNTNGNATLTVTASGQLVDIKFESAGNPTIIQTGVTVIDQSPYGADNYAFNFDNGVDYLGGTYTPDYTKFIHINCIQGIYDYDFFGTKQ